MPSEFSSSVNESQCISSLAAKLLKISSLTAFDASFIDTEDCNQILQATCPTIFNCPHVSKISSSVGKL